MIDGATDVVLYALAAVVIRGVTTQKSAQVFPWKKWSTAGTWRDGQNLNVFERGVNREDVLIGKMYLDGGMNP